MANFVPTLSGLDPAAFLENAANGAAQLIDTNVTFTDSDGNFGGGTVTVSGLLPEDIVSIRNLGTGIGEIGFVNGLVTYEGNFVGFAGIVAGTFRVLFGEGVSAATVDALLQNLTYASTSDTPTTSRTLQINITDGAGAAAITPLSFTERTGTANPLSSVDVHGFSRPSFADLDGDGDLDALVGDLNVGGSDLRYFENTGTPNAPTFAAAAVNPFGLTFTPAPGSAPSFADLDADGDLDVVVGNIGGALNYFQNFGSASAPAFAAAALNPFGLTAVGAYVTPTFVDLDNDGDLDAVIGEQSGELNYLQNTGTATTPAFAAAVPNPFGLTNVGLIGAPAFADLDRDGDLDAIVGNHNGSVRYFENIGTVSAPTFAAAVIDPFGLSGRAPSLADLDGDGDLDAIVGSGGILRYFENITPRQLEIIVTVMAENDAPLAQHGSARGNEDTAIAGTLTATDADGPSLIYSLVAQAAHGSVTVNPDGTFSYIPNADFSGTDSFTFQASDGALDSNAATVALTVAPLNDAPTVSGPVTLAAIDEDSGPRLITQGQLLANASDIDGPALSAVNLQIAAGAGALVDLGNGIWAYTPAAGDDTGVTLSYQVADGTASVGATATLDIVPAPQAPVPVANGTAGDDGFVAPAGGSELNGFGGIDTIAFDFKLIDATVTYAGNTVDVDGPSGHTVLTGFERFVFTDGIVDNNDGNWLVDDLFYYSHNHDVWSARVDAESHYDTNGWHEWRDPNAFFSTSFYLAVNPDVKAAGVNPLEHFHATGWAQGRQPSTAFDVAAYLEANPDVAAAHIDPLAHFLQQGAGEGRQPVALASLLAANGFDYVYYLANNPDVAAAHVDPFRHFEQIGWKEGRDPNALFDVSGYLAAYADVAAANVNPLDHYDQSGWKEGRDPSGGFDTISYLAANPDVAAATINPLAHFLQLGVHEGRSAFADGVWA